MTVAVLSRPPLSRRHAIVTGASRGIGAAIARRLARDGVKLTLLARTRSSLETLALELESIQEVRTLECDVTDRSAVEAAIAHATRESGAIDILVNNAGQAQSAPLARTSDELWHQMLAVNLTGTFLCTRAVIPGMLAAGWGRIVNVASTAGLRGYGYVSAYVAAKHGVIGLTRSLALELATKGVTVNAVCPGYTETDMLDESVQNVMTKTGRSRGQALSEFATSNPQGRLVQPDEVAAAVAFLCSPQAASLNGVSMPVAGGEVM